MQLMYSGSMQFLYSDSIQLIYSGSMQLLYSAHSGSQLMYSVSMHRL